MRGQKFLSFLTALSCVFVLVGWWVLHSGAVLFFGLGAFIVLTIIQMLTGILQGSAILTDIVFFVIGAIIGIFVSTPFWVVGILAVAIGELILNLIEAFLK